MWDLLSHVGNLGVRARASLEVFKSGNGGGMISVASGKYSFGCNVEGVLPWERIFSSSS